MSPSEKLVSLQRYLEKTKHQLNMPVPEKRKGQEEQYKAYLKLEVQRTQSKIDMIRMTAAPGK